MTDCCVLYQMHVGFSYLNLEAVGPFCSALEGVHGGGLEVCVARTGSQARVRARAGPLQLAHAGDRALEGQGDLIYGEAAGAVEVVAAEDEL